MTERLIGVLEEAGNDVDLVDRRFSSDVRQVGHFEFRKIGAALNLARRLWQRTGRIRPNVAVFFATNRTFSFLVDVALSWILRRRGVPVITYLHTNGWEALSQSSPVHRALVAYVLRTASTTVVLGESLRSDAERGGARNVVVVPNAVPSAARQLSSNERRYLCVFIGNLLPDKGYQDFLEVAESVAAISPHARFAMAGAPAWPGQLDEIRAWLADRGVRSVDVLGPIVPADRDRLLRDSSMLVFPSTYALEAQPLAVIEAMAMGLPIIAYDNGGLRDLVVEGTNGFLVRPGDTEALREAVVSVASDGALQARLSRGAVARFDSEHSIHAYGEAWQRILGLVAT